MTWLSKIAQRRFKKGDIIRYFTEGRKGKGRGIVLTPDFQKGTVVGFDPLRRHYVIENNISERIFVHPRNLMHDKSFKRKENDSWALDFQQNSFEPDFSFSEEYL